LDPEGGVLGIAVGDVSGKGMRAAMTAALASGMVRAEAGRRASVSEMMTSLNRSVRGKTERHMFTALCLASVDPSARALTGVNAGLCEPLLKSGAAATYLGAEGPSLPLGAFPDTAYRSRTVPLGPGDAMIFFTDGVPEAADRHGVQYGYEALSAFVARLDPALTAVGMKEAILREVARFSGGARPHDDVAVVVVRRN
ncbi:MAG TPA: PP2C family protein-serine/threonine phosphatase, partial [Thermoanaerobaculia bacterium]|nr:PP2C family protein-serine/threonine phosphatase [Thermoanaerobaculia bacterium]